MKPPESVSSDDVEKPKPDVAVVALNTEMNASDAVRENLMIPVFSEWTQQQMQEAEKKLVELTNSTEPNKDIKNETLAKHQIGKMRQKNYASPDCGAKVLASNPEAQSTSSVLTVQKDEYLLSPCTDRIWFVVELCDSIQAQRVELANFELFSSPLKAVTISVSNRFPTREWTPAGQFVAKTERDVQVFDLSSTLFGKFVRVDLTYTNTEHYCPLSFFRIFGTSEIEAFETENEPTNRQNSLDVDDDFEHQAKTKIQQPNKDNILNRAGAAVMSIVQKAAEVLVKSNDNGSKPNITASKTYKSNCVSFSHSIMCQDCSNIERIELDDLISCKSFALANLLGSSEKIRVNLINSVDCHTILGFPLELVKLETPNNLSRKNFLMAILPKKYIAAMCNFVAKDQKALPPRIEIIPGINSSLISKKDEVSLKNVSKKQTPSEDESLCKRDFYEPEQNPTTLNLTAVNETVKANASVTTMAEKPDKATQNVSLTGDELNIFNIVELEKQPETSSTDSKASEQKVADEKKATQESKDESKPEKDAKVEIKNEIIPDLPKAPVSPPMEIAKNIEKPPETKPVIPETKPVQQDLKPPAQEVKLIPEYKAPQSEPNNGDYRSSNPPESVFLRLSNRIKTLEKNMTLSTQYLEELSRRYKKQIEELQQSFSKLQSSVDEQSAKKREMDNRDGNERKRLREEVVDVTLKAEYMEVLLVVLTVFFFVQMIFVIALFKRISILRKAFAAQQLSNLEKELVGPPSPTLSDKSRIGRKRSKQRTRKISAPNILTQRSPTKSEFSHTSPVLSRTVSAPNKFSAVIMVAENKENYDDMQAMLEENDDILIPGFQDLKLSDDVSIKSNDLDNASTASAVSSNEKHEKSSSNISFKFKRRLSSPFQLKKSSMKHSSSDRTNNAWAKKAMSESPPRVASENSSEIQKSKSFQEDDDSSMKFKKSNSFKKLFKKLF